MKKMSFSGKYISKMFSLKKFLVTECIIELVCLVKVVGNQRYVPRKVYLLKNLFEQIGIDMAYIMFFFITMHEIDTAAEVYLEPFPKYMFELFCKNS